MFLPETQPVSLHALQRKHANDLRKKTNSAAESKITNFREQIQIMMFFSIQFENPYR